MSCQSAPSQGDAPDRAANLWFVGFTNVMTLMTEIETWHPPQSALAIEYTRAVLDEVRDQSVAGYRRLSRGGVEVGGILYGTREDGKVRILATRPIACEYKSGPSLVLSERDKSRLLEQLSGSESNEDLKGLTVVGWYVSHPRSSISLTEGDLEIFNEFFPAIWNVTLVLKPSEKSVRCGFFVREPRGSLNIAHSYQEFELPLPRSAEGVSAVRQIADQVASSLAAQREPVAFSDMMAQRRRGGGRREVAEMPFLPPRRPGTSGSAAAAAAAAPALDSAPIPWSTAVARPRSAIVANRKADQPRRLKWRWLVLWMFGIAALVSGFVAYREFTAPAPLGLHVAEKDGDLVIEWDPGGRPLRLANSGRLEIRAAGQDKTRIDLTAKELASGRFLYTGSEGDTSIHLTVTGKLGYRAEESARYLAQMSPVETSADKPIEIRDRRKLQAEVRRLREELEESQQRVKELETLLYNR